MTSQLFSERLYLSREGGADVFVPERFARQLRPFQRDGIRFLYRLFTKKRPGAILNDPAAYGKTLQAVLFIDAVSRSLQPLPALILCSPDDVPYWKYHYHLWTDSAKEILDESMNIYSKKGVFISPICDVSELIRREWGIVVIDNVNVAADMKLLKTLTAQFKVWLSNENLLKNVTNLALIHEWINNHKLDLNLFKKVASKRLKVEQAIARDEYLQNFILRRTNEDLPLPNEEENMELFATWKENKTREPATKTDVFRPMLIADQEDEESIHSMEEDVTEQENMELFATWKENKTREPATKTDVFRPMLIADQEDEESIHSMEEDVTEQVRDINLTMKRIEELANKQFKGSILDSLF